MDNLVNEMVDLYLNNKATWSEIQDIVEGSICIGDYRQDFELENQILSEIEKKIVEVQ